MISRGKSAEEGDLDRRQELTGTGAVQAALFSPEGSSIIPVTRDSEKRVFRESRRSPVGANHTRPIGRSAGSNQIDKRSKVPSSHTFLGNPI